VITKLAINSVRESGEHATKRGGILYIAREDAERGEMEAMLCMLGRLAAAVDADTAVRTQDDWRGGWWGEICRNGVGKASSFATRLRHRHTRPVTTVVTYTAHLNEADVLGPSKLQRFNLNLSLLPSLICPDPCLPFPLLEVLADVHQVVSPKIPCPYSVCQTR
jgi:hypothetical protein